MSDALVAIQYLQDGQITWAVLTFTWVVLPSVVVQVFSARWYAADGKMHGVRAWAVHIFLLQPLERLVTKNAQQAQYMITVHEVQF